MDDWRIQPPLPQHPRLPMNSIGPIHHYQSMRSRPSPYHLNEMKPTYQYQQSPNLSVKTDSSPNVYTPLPYPPTHMEQIHHQSQAKSTPGPMSTYHPGQQQIMSTRARSMPYPSPSLYPTHSSGSVCQCTQHMHYPSQHHQLCYPNYYPTNSNINKYEPMKTKIPFKTDENFPLSTAHHPSTYPTPYIPAQQLPPPAQPVPVSQEYQTYSNQSQIFPSPSSNPSTPYQNDFNGNAEFGVPYQQGQPGSVNSLTDALCPSGETIDRQLTPGPPSVGTSRVVQHQYSFPHTPLTPATSRLSNEQNIDELTAFLQDPMNIYLTDDLTSTLFEDIEALADTYLGGGNGTDQSSNMDNNLDYDIILNYLCSDDLINTVCTK